jgi:hypothetical protein
MGLVTRAFGASYALERGNLHESCRPKDANKWMDLKNNAVGRAIGMRTSSFSSIRTACLNALKYLGFRLTWIK